MLINNIKWKEDKITEKVIEFVTDNSDVIEFVDQCGLNAVIDGKWTAMDLKFNQQAVIFLPDFGLKYNCFGIQELVEAKRNPVIVHYTGSSKPWQFPNKHPLKHLYWQYLSMTPFKRYFPDELTMVNVIKSIIPHQLKSFIHRRLKA
jgi:lipopolysaccharide biosynthesis glycosyltransferase